MRDQLVLFVSGRECVRALTARLSGLRPQHATQEPETKSERVVGKKHADSEPAGQEAVDA